MRGRKPTPTLLKKLHGNPSKTPPNKDEPIPIGDLDQAPDWMTDEQRLGWDYAVAHAPPGLLRLIDRSALAVWVVAEDLWSQACVFQARAGLLTRVGTPPPKPAKGEEAPPDTRPLQQSPFLPIINKQAQIILKAAAELGFTPASRSRVATSPHAALMGGGMAAKPGELAIALDDYLAAAPKPPIMH